MAKYCIECGSRLAGVNPKFCSECGAKVPIEENKIDNVKSKPINKPKKKSSHKSRNYNPYTKELPDTGYYNVKDEYFNKRVRWAYYYRDSRAKRVLRNFHLEDLKKAVLKANQKWELIDEYWASEARKKDQYFDEKYKPVSKTNGKFHEKFKAFNKLNSSDKKIISDLENLGYPLVCMEVVNNTPYFFISYDTLKSYAQDYELDWAYSEENDEWNYELIFEYYVENYLDELFDWFSKLDFLIEISHLV